MKEYLRTVLATALQSLDLVPDGPLTFDKPRQAEHGDLTTNIAMVLAKKYRKNPRQLAAEIINRLKLDPRLVRSVEPAGPGFINFAFTDRYYQEDTHTLVQRGLSYGRSEVGMGKKTQVEFVSANPTGPLTVGRAWGAVFGDTVSRLLEWTGHDVMREYYFNNAGGQMRRLGDSVRLRYLELLGDPIEFPEDYYRGEYIRAIARRLKEKHGDALRSEPAEGIFKTEAEEEIFAGIRSTLKRLGIVFQSYYNESSLYEEGKVAEVLEEFRSRGLVYEDGGALWLKLTALGGQEDKVIVKNTGEPTYRLPDIAYHREKFRRSFDLMVDVFGTDHIATYPDVLAGLKALGLDVNKVKVLIHQFVTITQGGEKEKMSTRKANAILLDEFIDEVGSDAVRYFFIMRTITSQFNFDVALAKKQSEENPVYYVQYAHARICSVFRHAAEKGIKDIAFDAADYTLLCDPSEIDLMKALIYFPELVESCASTFEPHRITEYLHTTAGLFHWFYHECKVVSDDAAMTQARLALCEAARIVFRNGFSILGISAPEEM